MTRAWFKLSNGRSVYRSVPNPAPQGRSDFPCPRIVNDAIEPTCGADGKMYTSMSAYRQTLKASGNPRGEEFIEYGNEPIPEYKAPEFSKEKRMEDIKQAIHDVESGNIPVV